MRVYIGVLVASFRLGAGLQPKQEPRLNVEKIPSGYRDLATLNEQQHVAAKLFVRNGSDSDQTGGRKQHPNRRLRSRCIAIRCE